MVVFLPDRPAHEHVIAVCIGWPGFRIERIEGIPRIVVLNILPCWVFLPVLIDPGRRWLATSLPVHSSETVRVRVVDMPGIQFTVNVGTILWEDPRVECNNRRAVRK